MNKLLTLAVLAAVSTPAFATNEITGVFHSKYTAKSVEVHFFAPDGHNDKCQAELREPNYPNTVRATRTTSYHQGPNAAFQWAYFDMPYDLFGQAKQVRISCDTEQGPVQKLVNLPSPPKATFTLNGTEVADGTYDIAGGVYVEGYGNDTRCYSIEPRSLIVGHRLFEQQLHNQGSFNTAYIPVSASNINLFEGYGHAGFECLGVGGGVEIMVEFRDNGQGGLTFTQQELSYK